MDVDLYNTRKKYTVIESLDLMRNITWLVSCFSKIKKPNKHCSGSQSVIAGVSIFTQLLLPQELYLIDFDDDELAGGTTLIRRTIQKERTELKREMSSSRKCEMFSLLMN
jgi:hypothetical protein